MNLFGFQTVVLLSLERLGGSNRQVTTDLIGKGIILNNSNQSFFSKLRGEKQYITVYVPETVVPSVKVELIAELVADFEVRFLASTVASAETDELLLERVASVVGAFVGG